MAVEASTSVRESPEPNAPGPEGELVARLMASQYRHQSVIERAPGALLVVDANLAITDVNPEMLQIAGRGRRELVGSPLTAFFNVPETAGEAIRQAFASGGAAMFELSLRLPNADGSPAPDDTARVRETVRCIFSASLR
jgi:PAS domain S-box-containing protein